MVMDSCSRWLFAFLFLFTASKYECLSSRTSSTTSPSGSILLFAAAQDKPFFTTPQFTNITHRTFVCDRFTSYANGSMDIRDSLEGLNLSVGIVDQGNDIFFRLNRSDPDPNNWSINETDPGIFVRILDELAARGKFNWRSSFAFVQPPRTNETNPITGKNFSWTDVLLDAVERYDFSFAEWVHNQERRRLGISFPVGWFDSSTILVQNKVETVAVLELAAFLRPFSVEVWYLICAVIFYSGVVYWFIDKIEYPNDKIDTVVYDTFFTTLTITQHHMYMAPTMHSKRLFAFSMALWALILASAYTANLASFLVTEQRPIILAETLEEVEQGRLPLCVRSGAAVYGQVSRNFGDIDFRQEDNYDAVYESLRAGRCDLIASRKADFDAFQNDKFKNPDCSLEWVGRVQFTNTGGPGTLVDTSNYCTSVIRHVLDVHMHDLIAEGRIDYLWKSHLRHLENYEICDPSKLEEAPLTPNGIYALQIKDVGGVFVFHAGMIMISFLVTFVESPWRRKRHRKRALMEAAAKKANGEDGDFSSHHADEDLSSHDHQEEMPRPSMERLASSRAAFGRPSTTANTFGGRPAMERLSSTRGRPSMERLSSSYGRPSMENRSSSARSLVYSDFDDSYRSAVDGSYRSSISGAEMSETDQLLRSIQRMKIRLDRLQKHATKDNKKTEENDGLNTSSRASNNNNNNSRVPPRLAVIADGDEEEEGEEEDDSSSSGDA